MNIFPTFIQTKSHMKRLLTLAVLAVLITSCGSSRQVSKTVNTSSKVSSKTDKKADRIVDYALSFEGTRYKFGGTSKKGMDCSGLVFVSFQKENIDLPRISRDMASRGRKISLNQVNQGDLVFFRTNKNRGVINHVGLVVESQRGKVRFIHATTSSGVIISSLDEHYWKDAFVEVRRII